MGITNLILELKSEMTHADLLFQSKACFWNCNEFLCLIDDHFLQEMGNKMLSQ